MRCCQFLIAFNEHRYKRKLDWNNSMTKQRLNMISPSNAES
jgi:hypothetical protein